MPAADSLGSQAVFDSVTPDAQRAESTAVARDEWNVPEVVRRLEEGGLVANIRDSAVKAAGFDQSGTMLDVSGARLLVFIYQSYSGRDADMKDIDTVSAAPRGKEAAWDARPQLIQSGNLAAVLLGASPILAERVQNVLLSRHFAPPR
jgi:hypothetical protein